MQVSPQGPPRDLTPLTMMKDGLYVRGELWDYWHDSFPRRSVRDMFDFVAQDIEDESAALVP